MNNQQEYSSPDGVLIINKHAGVTSHDIVGKIRKLYATRAVGHAGTLDPMATGVLVVLLGRAAKAAEYLSHEDKHYLARLRLGITTDTQDVTGAVLSTSDNLPSPAVFQSTLENFRGTIFQVPPMYSALKIAGHKLVDLARAGVTVERQSRPITIYSLTALPTDTPSDYILDVFCSGGTYIRTLCADIGQALGCGGIMAALERQNACGFSLEQSKTIAELEDLTYEDRLACLIPTEQLFKECPRVILSPFYDKLCQNGCAVAISKLKLTLPVGDRVRLCHSDGSFFALGEIMNIENEPALKAIKIFVLPDQKQSN